MIPIRSAVVASRLCFNARISTQVRTLQVSFVTNHLPPNIAAELDAEASAAVFAPLLRRRESKGVPSSPVAITPSSAQVLSWKCAKCAYTWTARPRDRCDPQFSDASGCPRCRAARHASVSAVEGGLPGKSSSTTSQTLLSAHPMIAAQWDELRNSHAPNRVVDDVTTVLTSSTARVWWLCPACRRPWKESVASRVSSYEALCASATAQPSESRTTTPATPPPPVCPSCTPRYSRGASFSDKQHLSDEPTLLKEARLRPGEDASAIPLNSPMVLHWQCLYCEHEYTASVADRHEKGEGCPQCSGRVRTPLNLLCIQRPDVVHEVAYTISRTRLRSVTVHDNVELPFVCRQCLSPYRMTARARCSYPAGVPACPKCFHALSAVTRENATRMDVRQLPSRQRNRALPKKLTRKARMMQRSSRASHQLAVAHNDLSHKDHAVKN